MFVFLSIGGYKICDELYGGCKVCSRKKIWIVKSVVLFVCICLRYLFLVVYYEYLCGGRKWRLGCCLFFGELNGYNLYFFCCRSSCSL